VNAPAVPPIAELQAPPAWRTLEFISDLHLQAEEPQTFDAWRAYMASSTADAIFVLGDLFEVWIGDDIVQQPGFAADCAAVLQAAALRAPVFLMHGNRDFLMGDGLLRSCAATLLSDPTVLGFGGQRWLLTHGDALCISDTAYMQFREQVRSPQWQRDFLAKPLAERQAIGRAMRAQSEARKREGPVDYGTVDEESVKAWLDAADARTMIHGHTHLPANHEIAGGRRRIVLSDWDMRSRPARHEVLRLTAAGTQRITPS
jgi:UDP-2,3-diacylglucosamine hydrolase